MAKLQALEWSDLRFLLAVARCRSLAGAARQLGVNESTVSRRVARAERSLAARVFERSAGSFRPTEAGAVVLAGAENVEATVRALESTTAGADQRVAGVVRLTAVPWLLNRVLVPALPGLLCAHPGLRLELIAEPRDLSLTRREADVALRLARPSRELGNLARRVGRLDYAAYEAAGAGPGPKPWITYEDSMAELPHCRWMAERMREEGAPPPPLMVNDAEAIIGAVRAGLGVSLLPVAVGDREPGLRRFATALPAPARELWLLTHPDLRGIARVRVLGEWLAATLAGFTATGSKPASGAV